MHDTPATAADAPMAVDETLIRWMLSLTPEQRLAALQGAIDSAHELAGLAVQIRKLLATLHAHGVAFVVVGGVAAVMHGALYTTFDLNIVHDRSDANVARLLATLTELDARYRDPAGRGLRPSQEGLRGPG